MDVSRNSCRLCLSETDFNVSLFDTYSRKSNMLAKILVCVKLVIEETDYLTTICYKCANNIEKYYEFISCVKKAQTKSDQLESHDSLGMDGRSPSINRRHVTSYVREQVIDADYTFSFLELPKEEKKEQKASSPFFSYFSPPNVLLKKSNEPLWKTPRCDDIQKKRDEKYKRQKSAERPRHHSRDLFESQSQDIEEEPRSLNWKLTPDENIIKRVRDKCFGRSDF